MNTLTLRVVTEAIQLQTRVVRDLENQLSCEVNAALKKFRQPLVSRMADALRELRAVDAENAQIGSELSKHHVNCGDNIAFVPVSYESAFDARWFAGVKQQGYVV
jgi:hypothetical protein